MDVTAEHTNQGDLGTEVTDPRSQSTRRSEDAGYCRQSKGVQEGRCAMTGEQEAGSSRVPPANHDEEPEAGTPQGAVISPLLANIYLNPLDHEMVERGWEMVRYADDFVVLCPSQVEAEAALDAIMSWVEEQGLTLHPEKTRIVDARARGETWPRPWKRPSSLAQCLLRRTWAIHHDRSPEGGRLCPMR